jgi:hypothetical protein
MVRYTAEEAYLMPEADIEEFNAALGALGDHVPDSVKYRRLGE